MIITAISTILGMIGGTLPDIMKEVRDSRNHGRELAHMRLQAELQRDAAQLNNDAKLREIDANVFVAEAQAFREHLNAIIESQGRPTGIKWIDGFNAVLRPAIVCLIMVLFLMTAGPFVWSILAQFKSGALGTGAEAAELMAKIIWGSLVGESIMAVMGFLFGYRSSAKRPGAVK